MYRSIERRLPRERVCSAMTRRLIEQRFADQLATESLDDLKLVASELVDNAYLHGAGEIRVKLLATPGMARVEVMDQGHAATIKMRRPGAGGGGNGLRLVDHLCPEWGAFEGSTHVWAELPTRSPGVR